MLLLSSSLGRYEPIAAAIELKQLTGIGLNKNIEIEV